MSLFYHVFPTSMVIHYDNKTYTISKDDVKFKTIYDLIKSDSLETVGMLVTDPVGFENYEKVKARLLEALKGYEK